MNTCHSSVLKTPEPQSVVIKGVIKVIKGVTHKSSLVNRAHEVLVCPPLVFLCDTSRCESHPILKFALLRKEVLQSPIRIKVAVDCGLLSPLAVIAPLNNRYLATASLSESGLVVSLLRACREGTSLKLV